MSLIPFWAKALILLALVAAATVMWNHYVATVELRGYNRAAGEYAVKLATVKDEALVKERALQTEKENAENEAQKREVEILALRARNAATVGGLSNQLADYRSSLSRVPLETCRATAATLATVFGNCVKEYNAMAEIADRHASDVRTLSEAP